MLHPISYHGYDHKGVFESFIFFLLFLIQFFVYSFFRARTCFSFIFMLTGQAVRDWSSSNFCWTIRFLFVPFYLGFWCYSGSFHFLCFHFLTLWVMSGASLLIFLNTDSELPKNHYTCFLYFARKNNHIFIFCPQEWMLFKYINERWCSYKEFVEKTCSDIVNLLPIWLDTENVVEQIMYYSTCRKLPCGIYHFHYWRKWIRDVGYNIHSL